MRSNKTALWAWVGGAIAALLAYGPAQALVVSAYQTESSFVAATAGLGSTHLTDFDNLPVGTSFNGGSGPALSNFTLAATAFDPANTPTVQNQFWTTSGANYLGLDNNDAQFSNGDTLTFNLSGSVHAFGLYVVAASNDVQPGDLTLSLGGHSVLNASAERSDGNGSSAWFLGFKSDTNITSVTLKFGTPGDPQFFFNAAVDDVRLIDASPVPEPSTGAFMLLGLAGLGLVAVRRGRSGVNRKKNIVAMLAIGMLAAPATTAVWAGDQPYVGEIVCGAWNFAPRGTLDAAGAILPISQNIALFSLLGTTYGGNGVNNFQLPDLRGRVMLNSGQGPGLSDYQLGQVNGVEAQSLSINQMPAHAHLVTPLGSAADATLVSPAGAVPASKARTTYFAAATPGASMAAVQSQSAGGGQPVSTMQPYVAITCAIATQGVFPPRQ